MYLDIRRALVPSNDRRQREVLAAGLGGDQRAVVCIIIIVGVGAPRRRHYLRVMSIPLEIEALVRCCFEKIDRSIDLFFLFIFARIFCAFFSNSTPHKSLVLSVGAETTTFWTSSFRERERERTPHHHGRRGVSTREEKERRYRRL